MEMKCKANCSGPEVTIGDLVREEGVQRQGARRFGNEQLHDTVSWITNEILKSGKEDAHADVRRFCIPVSTDSQCRVLPLIPYEIGC